MSLRNRLQNKLLKYAQQTERQKFAAARRKPLPADLPLEYAQVFAAIQARLKQCAGVIDVGAHQGHFSQAALWAYGDVPCYCFEPNRDMHERLHNRLGSSATVTEFGLAAERGTLVFYSHHDSTMSSLVPANAEVLQEKFPWDRAEPADTFEISTLTLDDLPEQFPDLPTSQLILKLDTQGNELDILRSGTQFLKRVSVCVAEHMFVQAYQSTYEFVDLVQFFSDQGFDCGGALTISHRPAGEVSSVDFLFVNTQETS